LGVLTVAHSARSGHFDASSLAHLERIAAVASLALENAALLDATKAAMGRAEARGRVLDALAQITLELVAYEEPAGLLQRLTERTMALFEADAAVVYLLDDARQTFRRVAWYGESPGEHGTFGNGLSGRVMALEHGLAVEDYATWEGRDIYPGEQSQWCAAMGVPLHAGGRVIGAFTLASTQQRGLYGAADLEALARFAAVSSLALEKAELLGATRAAERAAVARLEQLGALDAVSLQLLAQRQPQEVIGSTLGLILPLVGATAGGYWRHFEREGELELTQVQHAPEALLGHRQAVKRSGIAAQILRTRGAMLVHDYQALEERDPALSAEYRAVILAPLVVGDSVLGILTLTHDQPGAFSHADLETVQRFAALASVALENARLLQVARRAETRAADRNALLETLHSVNLELGSYVRLPGLLRSILERAMSILGGHDGRLYLVGEDGSARLEAWVGGEPIPLLPRGMGASGAVIESGRGLLVADYQTWSGRHQSLIKGRWRSVVSVPLRRGAQVMGALTIVDVERAGRFDVRDLEVLERFAGVASLALEKAQLLEEARLAGQTAQTRAAQLEALYTSSLELGSELEPEHLLKGVLERARAFLGADAGGVFLNDPDGEHTVLAVGVGGRPPARVRLGQGAVGRVALSGEPVLVTDEALDPSLDADTQTRSLVCVPLQREGRVVGALAVVDSHAPNRFTQNDLDVLERFGALASVALENARLYTAQRQSLRDERVRLHITQAISKLRGVTETAQALVRVLALTLEYGYIAIALRDGERLHVRATLGYDDAPRVLGLNEGVAGRVIRSGRAELVTDSARDPDWVSASPATTSMVCVPLTSRDGVFGTLSIEGDARRAMAAADLNMLSALAPAFSTALENALLHEQLEHKAEELERLTLEAEHAARHDPLTKLRNRRAFEEDLRGAFEGFQRDGTGFSLAVLDLAGFKAVNDSLGHAAGDEALKRIAGVLRGAQDASRVAYRIGGDEFMLLIPDTLNARTLLTSINAQVQALELPGGLHVMPNIGVAACPADTTDPDRLQTLADKRMYAAKASGRFMLEGEDVPRPSRRAGDQPRTPEPDAEPG
jgi:diguanylate cyclase (GGDEF)-like protein